MGRPVITLVLACILTACGAQATAPHAATASSSLTTVATTPVATTPPPSSFATIATTPQPTALPTPRPTAPLTPRPTAAPTMMTAVIIAMNYAFSPSNLSVRVGTRSTFTNRDAVTHTFTANGGLFNSGNVGPGQSYSFTFGGAGSYAYHCQIHPSMTGTITVTG